MECQRVQELISGYLDETLQPADFEQVKEHLKTCSQCRMEYENLKKALSLLSNLEEVTPPDGFRPALMAKVAEECKITGVQGGSLMKKNKFFKGRPGFIAAGAVAAVLVLALAFGVMANSYGIFGTAALNSIGGSEISPRAKGMPSVEIADNSVAMYDQAPAEQKAKASRVIGAADGAASFGATPEGARSYGTRNYSINASPQQVLKGESAGNEKSITPGAAQVPAYQRKVIRNGRLELEVKSFAKAGQQVEFLTENAGGYIENMTTEVFDQDKKAGYYTLRIPAEQFNGMLSKLKGLGKVKTETLGGTDVTQEYYDTEARSRNFKKQELRILELLGKAKSLSDVLTLENELNRVRSEIETMEGRLNYLDNVVALATIQVELREKGTPKPDGPSVFSGILNKMGKQFANSASGILIFLAWALPGLILLTLTGGLTYFLTRRQ